MNPVHRGVDGIVIRQKCDVVVVMVGGEDKHMVPIKSSYVAIILYGLRCSCVIPFEVRCCTPKICKTGEKCWESMVF